MLCRSLFRLLYLILSIKPAVSLADISSHHPSRQVEFLVQTSDTVNQ